MRSEFLAADVGLGPEEDGELLAEQVLEVGDSEILAVIALALLKRHVFVDGDILVTLVGLDLPRIEVQVLVIVPEDWGQD